MDTLRIGDVARRTGLTERTLRYYEELGLIHPERNGGGQRRYDAASIDRLYRIRLQRGLGMPLDQVDPEEPDLLALTQRHLADVDGQLADLARHRERVRAVEARLLEGGTPSDGELLAVLSGLVTDEATMTRRLTLLVYRDIEAAQRYLVEAFGLGEGPLTKDGTGKVVHGEVYAGDGVIWMHQEQPELGLASPETLGGASHCMAIDVDDIEAHWRRAAAAGAEILYEPTDMPYGVREYSARDREGGIWSFHAPLVADDE